LLLRVSWVITCRLSSQAALARRLLSDAVHQRRTLRAELPGTEAGRVALLFPDRNQGSSSSC
jgi:hypothetical protein